MRISDWSSDVCSSDLPLEIHERSGQASLVLSSGGMAWEQRLLKRTFDLAIVCAIMPVLLPTLLIVALMVKLDSRGPAFFVAGTYRPWQSQVQDIEVPRSDARRVGKECVSTCRYRGARDN